MTSLHPARGFRPGFLALTLLPLLAGCAATGTTPLATGPLAVRQIELHQPATIPAGWATLRLQSGQPVAFNAVQEEEPHCILEVDRVSDAPQTVAADSFRVTAVRRSVSTLSVGALYPPAGYHFRRVSLGDDSSPTHLFYKTEFRLDSPRQPQVRSLTCMSNQAAPGIAIPRHLTLAEIHMALGPAFVLRLD